MKCKLIKRLFFALKHRTYSNPRRFWDDRRKLGLDIDDSFIDIVKVRKVIEKLNCNEILEVGCGKKNFSDLPNYIGLDFSISALKGQENRVCADVCHLPFKSQSFDTIISRTVLIHVPNISEAVKEIKRVARKAIILFEFQYDSNTKLAKHCFNHNYQQELGEEWKQMSPIPFGVFVKR